ncbi:hypothetical protein KIPB_010940 [Kipferlia bialata]|uniref:Uncharacterized protein n=1 Tax=Kipferlia bialata TaxID=797122 RepID=A0A9K3D7I1_9EUKA|nr:hypothetical protein KIPB_010940 [Kipferlia bialata]|eukprot:g10940.t1
MDADTLNKIMGTFSNKLGRCVTLIEATPDGYRFVFRSPLGASHVRPGDLMSKITLYEGSFSEVDLHETEKMALVFAPAIVQGAAKLFTDMHIPQATVSFPPPPGQRGRERHGQRQSRGALTVTAKHRAVVSLTLHVVLEPPGDEPTDDPGSGRNMAHSIHTPGHERGQQSRLQDSGDTRQQGRGRDDTTPAGRERGRSQSPEAAGLGGGMDMADMGGGFTPHPPRERERERERGRGSGREGQHPRGQRDTPLRSHLSGTPGPGYHTTRVTGYSSQTDPSYTGGVQRQVHPAQGLSNYMEGLVDAAGQSPPYRDQRERERDRGSDRDRDRGRDLSMGDDDIPVRPRTPEPSSYNGPRIESSVPPGYSRSQSVLPVNNNRPMGMDDIFQDPEGAQQLSGALSLGLDSHLDLGLGLGGGLRSDTHGLGDTGLGGREMDGEMPMPSNLGGGVDQYSYQSMQPDTRLSQMDEDEGDRAKQRQAPSTPGAGSLAANLAAAALADTPGVAPPSKRRM